MTLDARTLQSTAKSYPLVDSPLNRFDQVALTRDLVMAYGWNATAYQLVNPGIERWFSARGDAVVGYVQCKGYRVVAGSPVCAEERLEEVVLEWEADCTAHGQRICY